MKLEIFMYFCNWWKDVVAKGRDGNNTS